MPKIDGDDIITCSSLDQQEPILPSYILNQLQKILGISDDHMCIEKLKSAQQEVFLINLNNTIDNDIKNENDDHKNDDSKNKNYEEKNEKEEKNEIKSGIYNSSLSSSWKKSLELGNNRIVIRIWKSSSCWWNFNRNYNDHYYRSLLNSNKIDATTAKATMIDKFSADSHDHHHQHQHQQKKEEKSLLHRMAFAEVAGYRIAKDVLRHINIPKVLYFSLENDKENDHDHLPYAILGYVGIDAKLFNRTANKCEEEESSVKQDNRWFNSMIKTRNEYGFLEPHPRWGRLPIDLCREYTTLILQQIIVPLHKYFFVNINNDEHDTETAKNDDVQYLRGGDSNSDGGGIRYQDMVQLYQKFYHYILAPKLQQMIQQEKQEKELHKEIIKNENINGGNNNINNKDDSVSNIIHCTLTHVNDVFENAIQLLMTSVVVENSNNSSFQEKKQEQDKCIYDHDAYNDEKRSKGEEEGGSNDVSFPFANSDGGGLIKVPYLPSVLCHLDYQPQNLLFIVRKSLSKQTEQTAPQKKNGFDSSLLPSSLSIVSSVFDYEESAYADPRFELLLFCRKVCANREQAKFVWEKYEQEINSYNSNNNETCYCKNKTRCDTEVGETTLIIPPMNKKKHWIVRLGPIEPWFVLETVHSLIILLLQLVNHHDCSRRSANSRKVDDVSNNSGRNPWEKIPDLYSKINNEIYRLERHVEQLITRKQE